ncbi:putative kilA-n domain protein [Saudi moumouvirus]|nr:putative kilA-n domain protein [Saudi moumouvirus]
MSKKYSSKTRKNKYSESESESEIEIPVVKKKKLIKKVKNYESESESSETEIEINSKYDDCDIRNVIIKEINDKYAIGKMGDFKVIIMKKNGFINATNLCKYVGKDFKHWKENKTAKLLIKELISSAGIPSDEVIMTITGGNITKIRGTYVHPKLIIHIAAWCSAEYALKISDIVIEYHAKEVIEEKEKLLKKKDDKIDRLSKKIDEQKKQINKLLEQGNQVLGYAKDTNRKINVVVNERVPLSDEPKNEESFYIARNNDKPSKKRDTYDYKAIRITNKSKSTTMSKYYKNHPKGEIILKIKYTPNAKHLWNACKEKIYIKDENIEPGNNAFCYFNLCKNYSERQLKKDIMKIHNKRLKTEDL